MTDVHMHGHNYQRARNAHTCWGCGKTIEPGTKYWRCVVVVEARAKTLKTCKDECETIVDMIDQNQSAMSKAVFYPTLKEYMDKYPDTFKDEG